jgi:hypothetical protein
MALAGRDKVLALEPNFDFYNVDRVLSLTVDFELDELPSVQLVANYSNPDGRRFRLSIQLQGVRRLVLPEISSPFLSLPELEIEQIADRGMEGIRFEVVSHLERAFQCFCRDITIVDFVPA